MSPSVCASVRGTMGGLHVGLLALEASFQPAPLYSLDNVMITTTTVPMSSSSRYLSLLFFLFIPHLDLQPP